MVPSIFKLRYHRITRRKLRGAVDCGQRHVAYRTLWDNKQPVSPVDGVQHRNNLYMEYLTWFHEQARTMLKAPLDSEDLANIDDSDDDAEIADELDVHTREGTQPERAMFQNYMVHSLITLTRSLITLKILYTCCYIIYYIPIM